MLESNDNALVRRVITENTSKKLRKYLYKTVEEGTALPAKVAGYQIGGKPVLQKSIRQDEAIIWYRLSDLQQKITRKL